MHKTASTLGCLLEFLTCNVRVVLRKLAATAPYCSKRYFTRPSQNPEIRKAVNHIPLFQSFDESRKCLKPVTGAFEKIQSDKCSESSYHQSIHKSWFAASALHPRYQCENLTPSEWRQLTDFVEVEFPDAHSDFLNFLVAIAYR